MQALFDEFGDQIRLVYRDFPVVGGEQAAEAAECADEQGVFWDYHDQLFANPQGFTGIEDYVALAEQYASVDAEAFRECLESGRMAEEVNKDATDARSYGVTGTPTFFINGVRLVGAQPLSAFIQIIEEELKN